MTSFSRRPQQSDTVPFELIFGSLGRGHMKMLAHSVGKTPTTLYYWRKAGVPVHAINNLPESYAYKIALYGKPDERGADMERMYKHAYTLQEIGDKHGISRERVRQILTKRGVTGVDGGRALKALINTRYKTGREDRFMPTYGCFKSEVLALNDGLNPSHNQSKGLKYAYQRRTAIARKIAWEITFPEWCKVWEDSGKWELRGRGKGYCMARIGDTGPYHVDNVEIITCGQNFAASYYKHPWAKRFANRYSKTHCLHGHPRTPENLTKAGSCKTCVKEWNKTSYQRKHYPQQVSA